MLWKLGLFGLLALVWLVGCDLFVTREIRPQPTDIQIFKGLFVVGDTISFRVKETLNDSGETVEKKLLSESRLNFIYLGDSVSLKDTLKKVLLRVIEQPSGILIEQSIRLLEVSPDGVFFKNITSGGGARFFPMKSSAQFNHDSQNGVTITSNTAIDSNTFLALPAAFLAGWSVNQALGELTIERNLLSPDTISYGGHSEVAWKIEEKVSSQNLLLVNGKYWYGSSGLLKAVQVWNNFDWRETTAADLGKVDLVRHLERL